MEQLALFLPLPVVYLANLAVDRNRSQGTRKALATLVNLCIGAMALGLVVVGVSTSASSSVFSALVLASAILTASLATVRSRFYLAYFGLDPANSVHALAAAFSVAIAGTQLAGQLGEPVLLQEATAAAPLTPLSLFIQELPYLLAALIGVGWLSRRSLGATAARLGWVRPSWGQISLGLAAALVFYWVSAAAGWLSSTLTPGVARQVDAANQHLFQHLATPVGIAVIALAAGICEEALFRGALQPRFGLVWPAVLFALMHTQYGLSLDALAVLVIALGLGFIRRYANTSTTTLSHASYNALAATATSIPPGLLMIGTLVLLGATYLLRRSVLTSGPSVAAGPLPADGGRSETQPPQT